MEGNKLLEGNELLEGKIKEGKVIGRKMLTGYINTFYGSFVKEVHDFGELQQGASYIVIQNEDALMYLADTPDKKYKPQLYEFVSQTDDKVVFKSLKSNIGEINNIEFNKYNIVDEQNNINIWEIRLPGGVTNIISKFLGGKDKKQKRKSTKKKTKKGKKTQRKK